MRRPAMPALLPLSTYSPLISLTTPFTPPPTLTGTAASTALDTSLIYLYHEYQRNVGQLTRTLPPLDLPQKTTLFRQLLTIRNASPPLPPSILIEIESTLLYIHSKKTFTPLSSLPVLHPSHPKIALWRGDITTLSGVTAIVNAANSRMIGCFTARHNCIDNAIHWGAGPRLRADCQIIMDAQGSSEPNGCVKVTRGYLLPARYVLHTTGPQVLNRFSEVWVSPEEKEDLVGCYRSCLEVMEEMSVAEGESKSIAFCCVSAGVFGYPPDEAVHVAVDTVMSYLAAHPDSSIDRVVFNVFTASDLDLYIDKLNNVLQPNPPLTPALLILPAPPSPALQLVAKWLKEAPNLLITAGAGLSASDGLDYTSQDLFSTHFPGMAAQGFTCLYDFFGYDQWESAAAKWGYYFSHIIFVRSWTAPSSIERSVYLRLLDLIASLYGSDAEKSSSVFVRTSNADGLFLRSGFSAERIATPQGSYEILQCMAKCKPDAYWPVQGYIDKALPFLDTVACAFRKEIAGWEEAIPTCKYCGGEMFLCVRGGSFFTEVPFEASNRRYKEFRRRAVEEGMVVLELGAGFNTPGVIRWEDERLVEIGEGRVKLVRVGMNGSEEVEWGLEGEGRALGIDGDAGEVVGKLVEVLRASDGL